MVSPNCTAGTSNTIVIQVDFEPQFIELLNMVPTNGIALDLYGYYFFRVPTNAARAQFEINHPTGDMELVVRKGLPPPGPFYFDYFSDNPGTNDELIVVLTNSTPVALTNGDWYLTAINLSGVPVDYSIMASWWPVTGRRVQHHQCLCGQHQRLLHHLDFAYQRSLLRPGHRRPDGSKLDDHLPSRRPAT